MVGPTQQRSRLPVPDLARNRLLAAHGIQGHSSPPGRCCSVAPGCRDFVGGPPRPSGQHQSRLACGHGTQMPPGPGPGGETFSTLLAVNGHDLDRRSGQRCPGPTRKPCRSKLAHPGAKTRPACRARGSTWGNARKVRCHSSLSWPSCPTPQDGHYLIRSDRGCTPAAPSRCLSKPEFMTGLNLRFVSRKAETLTEKSGDGIQTDHHST